jgi:hypothetical protein
LIILLVVALEYLLLLSGIPECSDTANYMAYPGLGDSIFSEDALLYYWLYLLGDNYLWFQLIQLSSIVVFNFAIIMFCRDRLTTCFLALIPFLASIVGMHLWACAIRNGISFSFLILSLAILERGKAKSTPKPSIRRKYLSIPAVHQIFFSAAAILSIMLHWSAAFILLAVLFLSSSSFETFMYNIGKLRISYKFFFVAVSVFSLPLLLAFIFARKLQSYDIVNEVVEYGQNFPYVVIAIFFISVFLFLPWLRSRQLLRSYRSLYLLAFTSLLSMLPLLGFSGNIIRLLIPLQAISVLYMLLDSIFLSRSAIFFCLISPPFAAYSLSTYIGAYK